SISGAAMVSTCCRSTAWSPGTAAAPARSISKANITPPFVSPAGGGADDFPPPRGERPFHHDVGDEATERQPDPAPVVGQPVGEAQYAREDRAGEDHAQGDAAGKPDDRHRYPRETPRPSQ